MTTNNRAINNNLNRINLNLEHINNQLNMLINMQIEGSAPSPPRNMFTSSLNRRPNTNTTNPLSAEVSFMTPSFENIINTILTDTPLATNRMSTNNNGAPTHNTIMNNTIIDIATNVEEQCSICRENYQTNNIMRKINRCGHYFHHQCLDTWLVDNATCPNCRGSIY
jgi:hypothetical protein